VPFLIAFALAAAAMPVAIVVGRATGLVDRPVPGELKIHDRPIPLTGGVAVAAATLVAAGMAGAWDPRIAAGVALVLVVGSLDDVLALPSWSRVVAQALAGSLLVAGGAGLEPLGALGGPGVVALVLACTNAVNLMDGQDGLAGGLAAIAGAGLLLVVPGGSGAAELAAAAVGALGAFLLWNRPPARVFLGNGGAYAVGVVLAVLATAASSSGWPGLLAAGICLGVFGMELGSTVVRRVLERRPLAAGDRGHAYDLAAAWLGSRGRSTLLFLSTGAASVAVAAATAAASELSAFGVTVVYTGTLVTAALLLRRRPVSAVEGGSG